MSFRDAYYYSDAVFSQMFEGIAQKVDWTKKQLFEVNHTQVIGLTYPFTP